MQLRRKLDEEDLKSKFEGKSKILDDILNSQKPSSDKFGLGYGSRYSSFTNQGENRKRYDDALKSLAKKGERKKSIPTSYDKNMINVIPKRPVTNIYQHIFFGHCYSCHNFGHNALNCRAYEKFHEYKNNSPSDKPKGRNNNRFTLLQRYDLKCYKCNNHGHMSRNCKLMTPTRNTVANMFQDKKQKKY